MAIPRAAGSPLLFTLFLSLLLVATGCSSIDKALSGMDKPSASVQGAHLSNLSPRSASLVFDVKITNPYDADLSLANLDYALAARSTQFLTGQAAISGAVPARGSRVVQVPATVVFSDLLAAVSGVKLGQVVPYKADLDLSVNAPAIGPLHLPISHSGELPIPNVPGVELAGIKWGNVSLQSADATIKLRVTNTNDFPVGLAGLNYALQLDGQDVFDGKSAQPLSLNPGESGELDIPVSASASRVGLALVNMVRKAQASYSINGTTDLTTSFGPVSLPFNRSGSAAMSR
jgi:LEA14-like dessication related protein